MKTLFFGLVPAFFMVWMQTSIAQTNTTHPITVTDTVVSNKLSKDFIERNPTADKNSTVDWWEDAYGYSGLYQMNGGEYLSQYDQQGEYINSYAKKKWDEAPIGLRSAYNASEFHDHEVISYWQSSDPAKNGYYLQVKNKQGKINNVWVDNDGKLSAQPRSTKKSLTKPKK